jgi:hypothetical protein
LAIAYNEMNLLLCGGIIETINLSLFFIALRYEVASYLVAFKRAGGILVSSLTGKIFYKENLSK